VRELLTHVGVRSHQILFQQAAESENTFNCWLVNSSEAPHEMTLYLRLHSAPQQGDSPHLQADIPKEAWRALSAQPQPWRITIDPALLLLLED
jgi:molybdate transport system permease protein